jgi:hypothetical protein
MREREEERMRACQHETAAIGISRSTRGPGAPVECQLRRALLTCCTLSFTTFLVTSIRVHSCSWLLVFGIITVAFHKPDA